MGAVKIDRSVFQGVARLRLGLHVLVAVLALIVLLRAALLSEPHAGWISTLTVLFIGVQVIGVAAARTRTARWSWLASLSAIWLVLAVLGADAAYISFGLILLFMTELPPATALVAVTAVTAVNIGIGVTRVPEWGGTVIGSLLGAVVGIVIGLGFRVLFDETERRQLLIEDLRRTRAELAVQERTAGELAERQRLAQEIHDTVAQGLSSIQMLLHAAEAEPLPPSAATNVAMARRTAAAGLADTRRLIAALAPADLTGRSLAEALRRVCGRAGSAGDDIRLIVDGTSYPLPMAVESALVRLVQGATSNVVRHAAANQTVVTLTYADDVVCLDVVDDGRGFDVAVLDDPAAHGFGLNTMRARVGQLGGDWSIESAAGRTAMSVRFPLSAMAADR